MSPQDQRDVPRGVAQSKKLPLKKIMRFLFSHVGLCFLNVAHLSLGAVIFSTLEGDQDSKADSAQFSQLEASLRIDSARSDLINRLINDTKTGALTKKIITDLLDDYHTLIANESIENGYKKSITEADIETATRWSFSSVLLFTLSIASSIGYGHIYPKTGFGYFAVILYSLMAMPFFVMSLGSIGSGLAVALQTIYQKGFCCIIKKIRDKNQLKETDCPENEPVPATLGLGMVALYVLFGGLLFSYKEEWTYAESIYFCVVTFMTIGFGDFVPGWSARGNVAGQLSALVAVLYIVIGLALVSMALNVAVNALRNRVTIIIRKIV